MKKTNLLIIVMAVLLLMLTACGGKDGDAPQPTAAPSIIGSWNLTSASGSSDGQNYATMLEQLKKNNGSYVMRFSDNNTVSIVMTSSENSFEEQRIYSLDGNKLTYGNGVKEIELTQTTLVIKDDNAKLTFTRK